LRGGGEGEAVAELIMKQFQVILYKRSSPWGVGEGLRGVVAFIVSSDSEDFPRGAEKIAKKSRAEKIAAREIPAW
jgi:hypothetical protein